MCELLKVSRSGYYKWLKNKDILNNYEINRRDLGLLIQDIHKRKPSYGYHRINAIIKRDIGLVVSDNLVHKVCKILKIKSKAKHYKYKPSGEESIKFKNIVKDNDDNSIKEVYEDSEKDFDFGNLNDNEESENNFLNINNTFIIYIKFDIIFISLNINCFIYSI